MKNKNEAKIEKIVLDLGGEKVSLTPEQVQKLLTLLNDLFGQQVITIREPYPVSVPAYPYRVTPWYWGSTTPVWGNATYSANSSSLEVKI